MSLQKFMSKTPFVCHHGAAGQCYSLLFRMPRAALAGSTVILHLIEVPDEKRWPPRRRLHGTATCAFPLPKALRLNLDEVQRRELALLVARSAQAGMERKICLASTERFSPARQCHAKNAASDVACWLSQSCNTNSLIARTRAGRAKERFFAMTA